jgi:hypothetical protein
MPRMANRAYASIWTRGFSEETLLDYWERFLRTVPFSAERPGFASLVIRALDEAQSPVLEQELRSVGADRNMLVELAREHLHGDCSYQTRAYWDLWAYDTGALRWELKPQPLDIHCFGEEFGDAEWRENGHFLADIGFEHLFTGHAGLLGFGGLRREVSGHPEEKRFVALMSQPANLQAYQEKTRENIRKLYDWIREIEAALPVERTRLWSEGEENFEARIEEILARG